MKYIYHIHDQCCRHASNTLDDVVSLALKEGYEELYFTEHIPLDNNNQLVRPSRDEIQDLRKRIESINAKYRGELMIHFGYETEYSKGNKAYFDEFVKHSPGTFFIFGNHYIGNLGESYPRLVMEEANNPIDLDEYYENTILAMKSGLFSGYAHPDIGLQGYRKWDDKAKGLTKQIIDLSIKYKVPLGFNANGMHQIRNDYNYPSKLFWHEVAKTKAQVLVEADAHDIVTLRQVGLEKAKAEAIKYGLAKNLIEKIDIRYFP